MSDCVAIEPTLRLAVRELAEFSCRQGDLERGPAGPTAEQGRLAHQRLQRAEPDLHAEVALSRTCTIHGIEVTLGGRMDLVDETVPRLIELKSTLVPQARLTPGRQQLDRAQLALYAWLWRGRSDTGMPLLELRYVNLRSELIESIHVDMTADECDALAVQALKRRVMFEKAFRHRRKAFMNSAAAMVFPHGGMRAGQRSLAVAAYRSLRDGAALVTQAPTGSGKSLGTLFPAVKALGEERVQRVIWLTAKSSGRDAACAALSSLARDGLEVDALVVRSRRASCPCDQMRYESEDVVSDGAGDMPCEWTLDYHERMGAARQGLMEEGPGIMTGERLDALAREHRLCPHALAADLVEWFPVVVCDYNHVFDPIAALPRLVDTNLPTAVLIDEAHNLPRRCRDMYSAVLSRQECRMAARNLSGTWPDLSRAFDSLARAMSGLGSADKLQPAHQSAHGSFILEQFPEKVSRALKRVADALANPPEVLSSEAVASQRLSVAGALGAVALRIHRMLHIEGAWMPSHRCLVHVVQSARVREVELRIVCLDAADMLGKRLSSFHASVLMSATMTPLTHFRTAFGLPDTTPCLSVDSPFDASQWHCQLIDWVRVTYSEREASLPKLVDLVERVRAGAQGHYLVFLPSFAYLDALFDAFRTALPDVDAWRQPRSVDPATLARLLTPLEQRGHSVGFVITGGSFGEGVDYCGDHVVGAIVIGTGLAPRSMESDLAIAYHDARGSNGFDIINRYPGFVRVLQSAGRVVRKERDRGVVVFVDPRFGEAFYRKLMPEHWAFSRPPNLSAVSIQLEKFWNARQQSDNPVLLDDARDARTHKQKRLPRHTGQALDTYG